MPDTSADKIMGLIPKDRYVHFAYMFLLISAAGNVLYSLLAIVGINFASATPALIVLGLMSIAMAVIGLTKHKGDFNAVDHAHFKYMVFLFLVFFALYIVCGAFYGIAYVVGYLVTALLGAVQSILVWTGYNSWQGGRIITKDNIRSEIEIAKNNR